MIFCNIPFNLQNLKFIINSNNTYLNNLKNKIQKNVICRDLFDNFENILFFQISMSLVGKLKLGTKVLCNTKEFKNKQATVRYVGELDGKEQYIGLELETPDGLHTGQHKGKNYFQCKDKHGMFLKPKNVFLENGKCVTDLLIAKKQSKGVVGKTTTKKQSVVPSSKNKLSNQVEIKTEEVPFQSEQIDLRDESEILKQNKELTAKIRDLQQKLQTSKIQIEKVKYTVDTAKQEKMKQLTQQLTFFKSQKEIMEKDRKKLQKKIQALQAELEENDENNEIVTKLTIKIQTLQAKNDTLRQELQDKKTQLRNYQSMGQGATTEVNSQKIHEEVAILNETITLYESQIEKVKQSNELLQKQVDENKQKITQFNQIYNKLKKSEAQIEDLKGQLQDCYSAAQFAQKLTLKLIKKQQQFTQATKSLGQYVKQVEILETNLKKNQDMLLQYNETVDLLDQQIKNANKRVQQKNQNINELNRQIEKYKQKISQLAQDRDKMEASQILGQESFFEPKSVVHHDLYQQKFFESQKQLQNLQQKHLQIQIQGSEMKNQVGVYILNLMQGLPESFQAKFYPQVIQTIVSIKSANDKLYLLFDGLTTYLKDKNDVYSKDNIELAIWMSQLMDKISIVYSGLNRIQFLLTTSDSQQQISLILAQRELKQQLKRIDAFATEMLHRYCSENLSAALEIEVLTHSAQTLDKINSQVSRKLHIQEETKIKLCGQGMRIIQTTFQMIITYKGQSPVHENAQVDIHIQNFLKIITTYLRQCCMNPHVRYRTVMNKYLDGLDFISKIYPMIEENESIDQLGNLFSEKEQIKILRDTLITTHVYVKQLLGDLQQIQYSSTLNKVQTKLKGQIWKNRTKLIKDQLLRVKEVAIEKQQLEANLSQCKKNIIILEKNIKDKQNTKELYEKKIGELQLKVQQVLSLENQNKRQGQKNKALTEENKMICEELENVNKKKRQLEQQLKRAKQRHDALQTEALMSKNASKKTTTLNAEQVANLTIFKNVVKECSILKNMDTKKKGLSIKNSLIYNMNKNQKNTKSEDAYSLRRKALQAISNMKIYDPRVAADPNEILLRPIVNQIDKIQTKRQQKTTKTEYDIGKITLGKKSGTVIIDESFFGIKSY